MRERLRQERAKEQSRKRRLKYLKIGGAVTAGAVVVALIVWLVVSSGGTKTGTAPEAANQQGGLTLQSTDSFVAGNLGDVNLGDLPEPAEPQDPTPLPPGADAASEGEPAKVVIYADANCVHCAEFDKAYRGILEKALADGDITLEYRLVDYLDYTSSNNYSSRAASAAACVADQNPGAYLPFLASVYDAYGSEPSDEDLVQMAQEVGADISSCVDEGTYDAFVQYTSAMGMAAPVHGTPSVWVQGESWAESDMEFDQFLKESLAAK